MYHMICMWERALFTGFMTLKHCLHTYVITGESWLPLIIWHVLISQEFSIYLYFWQVSRQGGAMMVGHLKLRHLEHPNYRHWQGTNSTDGWWQKFFLVWTTEGELKIHTHTKDVICNICKILKSPGTLRWPGFIRLFYHMAPSKVATPVSATVHCWFECNIRFQH